MERLTIPDEPIEGGMRRAVIDTRAVKAEAMTIYWALKKYEDTGLIPEEILDGKMLPGWIPVEERLPEDSKYILLSFSNFSLPMVGRYEKDEEGGAFYLGDCDEEDTCVANDLSVNAWMLLPRPYRPEAGAALAGPDRAGLTPGPVQETDILQGERCKGPAASGRKGIPVLP